MFASPSLAHRIDLVEARLVRAVVDRVRSSRGDSAAFAEPVAGGWALFAGPGNPVNKVIGIGFDGVPEEDAFLAVERDFATRGSEVRAEVSTLARAETHEWLCRRGYVLRGFENVLGRPLGADHEGTRGDRDAAGRPMRTAIAGIDVSVIPDSEVDAWVATVTAGFASTDEGGTGGDQPLPPAEDLAAMMDDVFRAGGFTRYLARLDGEVAGGASIWLDGEVAILAGATTLPRFRRRGAQRALLEARLRDAADAGCTLAIVVTQPGTTSQANVQRQGFALLYARAVWVKADVRLSPPGV